MGQLPWLEVVAEVDGVVGRAALTVVLVDAVVARVDLDDAADLFVLGVVVLDVVVLGVVVLGVVVAVAAAVPTLVVEVAVDEAAM